MIWWIVKIALWALAGYVGSRIMNSGSLSMLWNIILGIVGGALGSLLASIIHFPTSGFILSTLISIIGACLAIWLARMILPKLKL